MHAATVYDVHPGVGGCTKPLPEALRLAACSMVGQRLPLKQIISQLQDAVTEGAFEVHEDYIVYGSGKQMYVPCASPGAIMWQYNWRVVRIER